MAGPERLSGASDSAPSEVLAMCEGRSTMRCGRSLCYGGSIRCCLRCRFCHVLCDKKYRILPSQKMVINLHIPDTRCLIYTCKIPANSLSNLLSYGDLSPGGSCTPVESKYSNLSYYWRLHFYYRLCCGLSSAR